MQCVDLLRIRDIATVESELLEIELILHVAELALMFELNGTGQAERIGKEE